MRNWKKIGVAAMLCMGLLAGCGGGNDTAATSSAGAEGGDFDSAQTINATTRENGSSTRSAFVELFGIQAEKDGEKVDQTSTSIAETNNTSVMMTTVANDEYAIGYISLGSLNDTVKAVKVDGVEPSEESVSDGSYKIARPFNIVTKDDLSDVAKDFVKYIQSSDGAKVIEENGQVPQGEGEAYTATEGMKGKIVVSGSSSVTPLMEKLKEAYVKLNPDVEIEVQQSDSSTGVANTIDGTCDIGMASRELEDSETKQGLTPTVIAMDGIAVIVNKANPLDNITSDQVKSIYLGDTTKWDELDNAK
ncbi:MAG: substrate-binding domain-containing protein [Peptococcaceae bacterium]|nr:substrate-binding domain-containing protein [Peptococcaceae bacterium]